MTMQVDLDAVIAAIEKCSEDGRLAPSRRAKIIAAIRAIPASNARIEAGEAMKAAILNIADIWNAPTERANPVVTAAMAMWIEAVETLDTATIRNDPTEQQSESMHKALIASMDSVVQPIDATAIVGDGA